METFRKRDVVLFPFPFTNQNGRKLRPCLVISNEMKDDIILCQITSQKISKDKFSLELKKNQTKKGSLMIDSYIRCNMLFTADKSQILKKVCEIDNEKYEFVIKNINKIIA